MAEILIVDDEDVLRKGIQIILEKEGYNAIEVNDAIKAQQMLNQKPFDVVITDICMPRISGVELMKSIHNLYPRVKLILITGNPSIETAKEAIRSGAFDYLTKPVSRKELCQTVKSALQIKALEEENLNYKENLELLVEEQTREIRVNEQKYRLLAENATDVIWTMDLAFNLTYLSPSVSRLLGYEAVELEGEFLSRILSPEAYNTALKFLKNEFTVDARLPFMEGERPPARVLEFEHVCKDGSRIWAEIRINFMLDYTNRPIGILGITRDISTRKTIELELVESEENFRNLADNAIDGIIIALEDGKHVYVNRQASEITRYSRTDLIGMTLEDLLAREEYVKIVNLYKLRNYADNKHNRCESVLLRADRTKVHVEFSSTRTIWHSRPADLIFLRDNSQRHEWERNLRRERDRIRQYLDIVDVILLAIDSSRNVILINRKGQEVLGGTEADILGKNWFTNFIPKHEYTQVMNIFNRFMAGELEPFYYNENRVLTLGGEERIIAWRNVALHDESGSIIGVLSSGEDITHKLAMEVQLRSSERRLNTIVNSSADGIVVCDAAGIALFVNPAAKNLLGKQEDEILGHPLDFEVESGLKREIQIPGSGEHPRLMDLNVVDIEWAGKFAYLVNMRDITEQKKARDNVFRLSQFQKSVIDNANVWLYVSDSGGEVVIWNRAAEGISGYTRHEVIGNDRIWEWLYPDAGYRQRVTTGIKSALNRNTVIENYETNITSRTGEKKTILWYIARMNMGEGAVPGILALGRDVSLRKETESKLQASFGKLQRALNGAIKTVILILETRDPYTSGHQKRVAEIAKTIALEMELPTNTVEGIYIAGSMHDIGKISVPVEILHKPGRLTETEFEIIKEHAKIGYDILKPIEFPWPVADIVYQHHEACNGKGYPRGLTADEIRIEAKILAVADVLEAISADRPYRPALGIEVAIKEITAGRGIRFDAAVVDALLTLYHEKGFDFRYQPEKKEGEH